MKKLFILSLGLLFSSILFAQNPIKGKRNEKKENSTGNYTRSQQDAAIIWEGTQGAKGGGPKPSKNQPAKVRAAFNTDYPAATNISWSKYRGDWTASFRNGVIYSTAVYHANGQRKDTRTIISKPELPKVIIDEIFKKRPSIQLSDIIKIEVPQALKDIFRIKTIRAGTSGFLFYDADGQEVKYSY